MCCKSGLYPYFNAFGWTVFSKWKERRICWRKCAAWLTACWALIKNRECTSIPGFNEDSSPLWKPNCENHQKRLHLNFITELIPVRGICGILQLGTAAHARAFIHMLIINDKLRNLWGNLHPVAWTAGWKCVTPGTGRWMWSSSKLSVGTILFIWCLNNICEVSETMTIILYVVTQTCSAVGKTQKRSWTQRNTNCRSLRAGLI